MAILLAIVLMALQDVFGTFLVVAEARGRPLLAGILDGVRDVPAFLLAGLSGATLVHKGWSGDALLVCAIACTSFATTGLATFYARRVKGRS